MPEPRALWVQAKGAISLAMKETTPEAAPAADTNTNTAAAPSPPGDKGEKRYGQRERTQVALYSPGRDGPQLAGAKTAARAAAKAAATAGRASTRAGASANKEDDSSEVRPLHWGRWMVHHY